MGYPKPFHRNIRAMDPAGKNAGYSSWAFIHDHEYARNGEHYVRALVLIQNELQQIFEYIEPSDEARLAYSYRIHALLMRTCIEIEANFKAILEENNFTAPTRPLKMADYRKVDASHHLSSYKVKLPIWNKTPPIWEPFKPWAALRGRPSSHAAGVPLPWYQAYNESKHNRQEKFKKANFETLVEAVAALLILVSSQFLNVTFSAGSSVLSLGTGLDFHDMEPSTGSLFRISYPNDWSTDESYDFDWSKLREEESRFEKFDFDAIPI